MGLKSEPPPAAAPGVANAKLGSRVQHRSVSQLQFTTVELIMLRTTEVSLL